MLLFLEVAPVGTAIFCSETAHRYELVSCLRMNDYDRLEILQVIVLVIK